MSLCLLLLRLLLFCTVSSSSVPLLSYVVVDIIENRNRIWIARSVTKMENSIDARFLNNLSFSRYVMFCYESGQSPSTPLVFIAVTAAAIVAAAVIGEFVPAFSTPLCFLGTSLRYSFDRLCAYHSASFAVSPLASKSSSATLQDDSLDKVKIGRIGYFPGNVCSHQMWH
jgi:hypothetical protein